MGMVRRCHVDAAMPHGNGRSAVVLSSASYLRRRIVAMGLFVSTLSEFSCRGGLQVASYKTQ